MTTAKRTSAKNARKNAAHSKKNAKKAAKPAHTTSRCWPGFEPVPGTAANEKGSCKPKKHQTAGQKKADSKAAAASKLQKGG